MCNLLSSCDNCGQQKHKCVIRCGFGCGLETMQCLTCLGSPDLEQEILADYYDEQDAKFDEEERLHELYWETKKYNAMREE